MPGRGGERAASPSLISEAVIGRAAPNWSLGAQHGRLGGGRLLVTLSSDAPRARAMSRTPEPTVALGSAGVAGKGPEENERRPLRGLVPRVPASARPEVPERGRSSPAARMAVACELAESLGPEAPRKARVCAREDVCACVVIMGHFQNGANGGLSTSQGRGSSFSVPALFSGHNQLPFPPAGRGARRGRGPSSSVLCVIFRFSASLSARHPGR